MSSGSVSANRGRPVKRDPEFSGVAELAHFRVHRFGDSVLHSFLPLQALPCGRSLSSAVIELDWDENQVPANMVWHHHWRNDGDIVLSLGRHGSDYWLRAPDVADFRLQLDSRRVLVARSAAEVDRDTLEHLLVDQILPRLLSGLDHLLVHASALRIGQQHALFLASTGLGKSTLAGLLRQRGHTVLSDDCLQLDAMDGGYRAIATYPSLRLNPDSLAAIFPGMAISRPMAHYSEKRRVPMACPLGDLDSTNGGVSDGSVSVDAMYLLGDPTRPTGDGVAITPLHPADTCVRLIKHSFRLDLADRAANAAHLARCSAAARAIPAFQLDYPRDFTQADALEHAISQHLSSLTR